MKKILLWKELTKGQKRKIVLLDIFLTILLAGAISYFIFYDKIHGEGSVFNKTFDNVPAFLNHLYHAIPQIIDSIVAIIIGIWITKIIHFVMRKSFAKTPRGITITQMLISFIKWIVAIGCFIWILYIWGVDTTTLLASAGVLTLVIGLGAQSLVADVVAGIFIVFEGEYVVGDIVVFNDWRGTVKEVGIRTTKIESAGGDVKIINNSEIRQIINQTQELSVAKCYFSVEYRESLQRVESIINDNLKIIKNNIPYILKGPFYKGVAELGDNGVKLLVVATCKEDNLFQVQRDLNREIKLLCERCGVALAFPQLTIHKGIEENTVATKKMAQIADELNKKEDELGFTQSSEDIKNPKL